MERLKLNPIDRERERLELAEDRKQQVVALYRQGFRQTEIGDRLGISQARVSQILLTVERNRTNKRQMLRLMPDPQRATV